MIELINCGNAIRSGTYEIHSRFRSVVNFISGDSMVFVVKENIGGGPLHIVLKGIVTSSLRSLVVADDHLLLDQQRIELPAEKRYNPFLELTAFDRDRLFENLTLLQQIICLVSPPQSLAFLFDRERHKSFSSSFEREYMNRMRVGAEHFVSGDAVSGVSLIKGVGYGLTPGGDDFIAGYLMALNLVQYLLRKDFSILIRNVYERARGANHFTNTLLQIAARGELVEKFKTVIQSLFSEVESDLSDAVELLLSVGETSGIDTIVGLILGIKRFAV
jgi:hypothetical protein